VSFFTIFVRFPLLFVCGTEILFYGTNMHYTYIRVQAKRRINLIKQILITIVTDKAVQGSKVDEDLACYLSSECQGKLFNLRIRAFFLLEEKGQSQVTCPYCGLHIADAEWLQTQSPSELKTRHEFQELMKTVPFK
jgi:hypothetical protein